MAMFRFSRTPKTQKFTYIPRYWDPDKEDLEERLERAKEMKGTDPEAMKRRIASGFKHRGGYQPNKFNRSRSVARSNMVLIAIVLILLLMTYMFIQYYLPQILKYLG